MKRTIHALTVAGAVLGEQHEVTVENGADATKALAYEVAMGVEVGRRHRRAWRDCVRQGSVQGSR